jgi:hypothetical protein
LVAVNRGKCCGSFEVVLEGGGTLMVDNVSFCHILVICFLAITGFSIVTLPNVEVNVVDRESLGTIHWIRLSYRTQRNVDRYGGHVLHGLRHIICMS